MAYPLLRDDIPVDVDESELHGSRRISGVAMRHPQGRMFDPYAATMPLYIPPPAPLPRVQVPAPITMKRPKRRLRSIIGEAIFILFLMAVVGSTLGLLIAIGWQALGLPLPE